MLNTGETVFPREEYSNWLPNTEWFVLKMHIYVSLYRLNRSYLGIRIYIFVYNNTQWERGHKFESKQEYVGAFGGREGKGEWYNYVLISKNKIF